MPIYLASWQQHPKRPNVEVPVGCVDVSFPWSAIDLRPRIEGALVWSEQSLDAPLGGLRLLGDSLDEGIDETSRVALAGQLGRFVRSTKLADLVTELVDHALIAPERDGTARIRLGPQAIPIER